MLALDPFTLDRRLAEVAGAWLGFRRALPAGNARDHRFENQAGFATLELLSELEQRRRSLQHRSAALGVPALRAALHRAALGAPPTPGGTTLPSSRSLPLQHALRTPSLTASAAPRGCEC